MNQPRHCKLGLKKLKKWLVTSVDAWMAILLTMGMGKITVDGGDAVDVTVARHVKSTREYIHVNRIYQAIADLTESGEHADWPSDLPPWLDDGAKNILSVLAFFLSGFDFLPGIVNCALPAM